MLCCEMCNKIWKQYAVKSGYKTDILKTIFGLCPVESQYKQLIPVEAKCERPRHTQSLCLICVGIVDLDRYTNWDR